MSETTTRRRWAVAAVATLAAAMSIVTPAPAQAARSLFFEEAAEAFWEVPHTCADGSVVPATLLVSSTRDFEAPATEDADPTARVQYLAVCPDSTSFSWGAVLPATITSSKSLKSVRAVASGTARDNLGAVHQVSFDVTWTGTGPLVTTVNGPGSKREQRTAVATGRVVFDGAVLVDGVAEHSTRPDPFIRVDTEK